MCWSKLNKGSGTFRAECTGGDSQALQKAGWNEGAFVLQEPSRPSSSGVALQQPLWPLWAGWGHLLWGHRAGTGNSLRQGSGLGAGQNLRGGTMQASLCVSLPHFSGEYIFYMFSKFSKFFPFQKWLVWIFPSLGVMVTQESVTVRGEAQGWHTGTDTLQSPREILKYFRVPFPPCPLLLFIFLV